MNNNNGKELIPQRGPPSDGSPSRQYTVNLGRKRDWLDRVGEFLDEEPRTSKEKRTDDTIRLSAFGVMLAVGAFCVMDSYHWNLAKFSADGLRYAIPFGLGEKALEIITPDEPRAKPGESPEELRHRRDCFDARLLHYPARDCYVLEMPAASRHSTDVRGKAVVMNSGTKKKALTK